MTEKRRQALEMKAIQDRPRLTDDEVDLKGAIEEAKLRVKEANLALSSLMDQCRHVFVKSGFASASCAVCGEQNGWWCPTSPDHICHYDEDEICTYCGQPYERK